MEEIWKPITGYKKFYEVSNFGRVKVLKRKRKTVWGVTEYKEKIMKLSDNGTGYLFVRLLIYGKHSNHYVHRLVSREFIKNPKRKPQVNHLDGNRSNNHVKNLEWCTHKENVVHSVKRRKELGYVRKKYTLNNLAAPLRGEEVKSSKLKEIDVIFIRKTNMKVTELMKKYNVCERTIYDVKRKLSWTHVKT